tara:strand:- start:868 stop:972 length:105 start_codon:yes stop_codon:yes gene_type:complete
VQFEAVFGKSFAHATNRASFVVFNNQRVTHDCEP